MGLYISRPDRLVIPRWRDFKETSRAGELVKERIETSPAIVPLSIQKQLNNWSKDKSVINAIELVNSAYVINAKESAIEAANFIIKNCRDHNNLTLKISKIILDDGSSKQQAKENNTDSVFQDFNSKISCKIREIRNRIKIYPNNTILWLDYARWYTVIGKFFEAERCIRTAIQLNPNNIFVIRSAVRFFLHIYKYDSKGKDSLSFALQLIRKSPATKSDPWLLATEISLSAYLEKTSNMIKTGVSMINEKKFNPFSLAELSAAIGTEEMNNGSNKSAKKLFTTSLIDPNENTTAQAEWATKQLGELPIDFKNTNSYEASSFHNLYEEKWAESFDDALNWMIDQPFSGEPANHASYLAGAIIDNNELAIEICNFGLRSNPKEFTLLNNKAYSLAVEKNPSEAEKAFSQIDYNLLTASEKITYTATKGLIQYSYQNIDIGSSLYDEAENLARKSKDEKTAFLVKVYKARAEYTFRNLQTDEKLAIDNLMKEFEKFKNPDVKRIIENLKGKLLSSEK